MRVSVEKLSKIPNPERKMTQWTKWALLRAISSAGLDAEPFRPLPTEFLRAKLLQRVSTREVQRYLNKTDTYILNLDALAVADSSAWLAECGNHSRARHSFPRLADHARTMP